jgi:hydroxyacyl-ACP dehydratase HTD2-like protein with hotdog domain
MTQMAPVAKPDTTVVFPGENYVRDFVQTPVSLFRFSALMFNGHKIHYDRDCCREVEGHRDIVAYGPLNLINMVDLWRDTRGTGDQGLMPKNMRYRATSPLYAGEPYRTVMGEETDNITRRGLWIVMAP